MTAHRHTAVTLGALAAFTFTALAQPAKKTSPPPLATSNADNGKVDLAYGAFQRGQYLTALNEATKRAQQNDPAAMTLLGEIYAQGLGVGRDDSKAAQWYKLAASNGDRDAMFALAMFNLQGRAGARDRDGAARLLMEA
ncbi:MAG TPA: tetratricopeptide repeat protein, partial [Pseudolabrys sp.]